MSGSLIYVNATQSSQLSPIAFFESFIKKNLIIEAKADFLSKFPNPEDEFDYWSRFTVEVDLINERFTVDYQIEKIIDEYNVQREWKTIEYSLETELAKLFKTEYEKSKILLLEKFGIFNEGTLSKNTGADTKNLRESLKDIRHKLLKCLEILSTNNYPDSLSRTIEKPIQWLVLFLYDRFSSILPKAEMNSKILEIVSHSNKLKERLDLTVLKPDTAEIFSRLKDKTGENIIVFKNPVEDLLNFTLFCNVNLNEIKKPIGFKNNFGAVNYLIGKLSKKLSLNRSKIEKLNIVKLGKYNFIADSCNTDYSRFPKINKEWADLIDDTFENCLS
jgi:hypothetical protein